MSNQKEINSEKREPKSEEREIDININSINAITRSRAEIISKEGPAALNQHTIEEWIERIQDRIYEADRNASYGYMDEAILSLIEAMALGLLCLDEYLADDENQPLDNEINGFKKGRTPITRYVSNHNLVCLEGQFYSIDPKFRMAGTIIEIVCKHDGTLYGFPVGDPGHKAFLLNRCNLKSSEITTEITMEALVLIARYEMYAGLEMHASGRITETFADQLSEKEQMILDRYLNAKIKAFGFEAGNATLHTKADAEASNQPAPACN